MPYTGQYQMHSYLIEVEAYPIYPQSAFVAALHSSHVTCSSIFV